MRPRKSPAMLFYLDNWLSEGPDSDAARGFRPGGANSRMIGPLGARGVTYTMPRPPRCRNRRRAQNNSGGATD